VGAARLPALAIAAFAILLSHTLVGHKEYRFIYFALMTAPIFIGVGGSVVLARMGRGIAERPLWFSRAAFIALVAAVSLYAGISGTLSGRFGTARNKVEAYFAVHRLSNICGLGVWDIDWDTTGGYSYLNRNIPIYYSSYEPMRLGVGFEVMLDGKSVPQYSGDDLLRHTEQFNYLLLPTGESVPNYRPAACFEDEDSGQRVCLARREGPCQ
jgi:hypothetical protein